MECNKGNDPVMECNKGNDPLMECNKGNDPVMECNKGNDPVMECNKGKDPVMECNKGNDLIIKDISSCYHDYTNRVKPANPTLSLRKENPGTMYATTHNGWMEETVFYNWIEKMFVPHVQRERAERNLPDQEALLIFDGDASHSSLRIIELAMKNKITMMSHLTDKIQPLDVAVFNPIKILWEKKLIHHGKTQIGKGSGILTKQQFSYLGQMWQDAMKPDNMKKGFEATGIIPFNPNKFDKKLFDKLEKYLTQKKRKETASGSAARLPNPVEELPSPESVRLPARVCTCF
ncbi:hypothetical protein WDU94_010773 [Cyamophila willieti]